MEDIVNYSPISSADGMETTHENEDHIATLQMIATCYFTSIYNCLVELES